MLDVVALEAAFGDVWVATSLRTVFPERSGSAATDPEALRGTSAAGSGAGERGGCCRRGGAAQRGLIMHDPRWVHLLRSGMASTSCLVVHHIAADGWSLGPLWRDVGPAYAVRPAGVRRGELAVHADHTLWQAAVLPEATAERDIASARVLGETLRDLPDR
jgi:hypothetical protein